MPINHEREPWQKRVIASDVSHSLKRNFIGQLLSFFRGRVKYSEHFFQLRAGDAAMEAPH